MAEYSKKKKEVSRFSLSLQNKRCYWGKLVAHKEVLSELAVSHQAVTGNITVTAHYCGACQSLAAIDGVVCWPILSSMTFFMSEPLCSAGFGEMKNTQTSIQIMLFFFFPIQQCRINSPVLLEYIENPGCPVKIHSDHVFIYYKVFQVVFK